MKNMSLIYKALPLLILTWLGWAASVSADEKNTADKRVEKLVGIQKQIDKTLPEVLPCIVSIGDTASGVLIKPEGVVLTSSHVTGSAGRKIMVRLHDGTQVEGITLGSNKANDTAAIGLLDPGPYPYLKTIPRREIPRVGQWCISLGYPLSWSRDGIASPRLGRITGHRKGKILTDCSMMGGDSGGALINLQGHLVAVNSSVRLEVTENLHVPIQRFLDDWKTMMSSRDVIRDTVKATKSAKKKSVTRRLDGNTSIKGSVLTVTHQGQQIALATVVTQKNHVVTKHSLASEIPAGELRFKNANFLWPGKLIGFDTTQDLALFELVGGPDPESESALVPVRFTVGEQVNFGKIVSCSIDEGGSGLIGLTTRPPMGPSEATAGLEDRWGGGPFSQQRSGFSDAFYHDTVLTPSHCGGPLVDLQGRFRGINIARVSRVSSASISAKAVEAFLLKHLTTEQISRD